MNKGKNLVYAVMLPKATFTMEKLKSNKSVNDVVENITHIAHEHGCKTVGARQNTIDYLFEDVAHASEFAKELDKISTDIEWVISKGIIEIETEADSNDVIDTSNMVEA